MSAGPVHSQACEKRICFKFLLLACRRPSFFYISSRCLPSTCISVSKFPPFLMFLILILIFTLLYNTVLVLPYIDMNPPRVYMSSQTWTPLPPPTPYHLSGSSLCTSPKHPVSCIKHRLVIRFLHNSIHVSMPFSQIIPPSLHFSNDEWCWASFFNVFISLSLLFLKICLFKSFTTFYTVS